MTQSKKLQDIQNDTLEIRPDMEPLTSDELEAFLARARAQGRTLTSEEQYAIFGPPPEEEEPTPQYTDVTEMESAQLDDAQLAGLQDNFFAELGSEITLPELPLVWGVIFDFDYTLAYPERPIYELARRILEKHH